MMAGRRCQPYCSTILLLLTWHLSDVWRAGAASLTVSSMLLVLLWHLDDVWRAGTASLFVL